MVTLLVQDKNSIQGKLFGLSLQRNIRHGIRFTTRLGIHSLLMLEPIDIVLVDQSNVVRLIRVGFKPWHILWWGLQEFTVVELPSGTIHKLGIIVGKQVAYNPTAQAQG